MHSLAQKNQPPPPSPTEPTDLAVVPAMSSLLVDAWAQNNRDFSREQAAQLQYSSLAQQITSSVAHFSSIRDASAARLNQSGLSLDERTREQRRNDTSTFAVSFLKVKKKMLYKQFVILFVNEREIKAPV